MNYDFRVPPPIIRSLVGPLNQIESAQLVRRLAEGEEAYLFKHALVQDSAYESLTRHERKRLHRLVAETLERVEPNTLDENASLLAYHFEQAEEWTSALGYLTRAADWAKRGAAHHEQAALLQRALELAERVGAPERIPDLLAQRGSALMQVTRWQEARADLLRALELLPPEEYGTRARVLVELATVTQWLWDAEASKAYARAAYELAEQVHDSFLMAGAMSARAFIEVSDGRPREGLEHYARVFTRTDNHLNSALVRGMEFSGIALYWLGEYDAAVDRSRVALERARELGDTVTIMRALSNLAITLVARGDFEQGLQVFQEARTFGRLHKIGAWLARSISMECRLHLDLFDYARAEELSLEAREVARTANFSPATVSAAIDLLLNYARRGEIGRAERFDREAAQVIPNTYGSHRWLWQVRHLHARAELDLARERFPDALAGLAETIVQSRATERTKYEMLAYETRARIYSAMGRHADALADAHAACAQARTLGDPLLEFRALTTLLRLEHDDGLAHVARELAQHILSRLPTDDLRTRFQAVAYEWM